MRPEINKESSFSFFDFDGARLAWHVVFSLALLHNMVFQGPKALEALLRSNIARHTTAQTVIVVRREHVWLYWGR